MGFGSISYTKSKELLIYIASKLSGKGNFGATLLNKALYFIDSIYYLKTGSPISEFTYIKQDYGPTPDVTFLMVRDELISSGEIELVQGEYFGRIQKKLIASRQANLELFSAEEIALIDEVLAGLGDWTGSQASDVSHKFPAWKAAENKEKLPFYTFLISSCEPSAEDISWAKSQLGGLHSSI